MLNAADSTKNVNAGKSDEDCDIFQVGIISLKKVNFLKKSRVIYQRVSTRKPLEEKT